MSRIRRVEDLEKLVQNGDEVENVVMVWAEDEQYPESLARAKRLSGRGLLKGLVRLFWPSGKEVEGP